MSESHTRSAREKQGALMLSLSTSRRNIHLFSNGWVFSGLFLHKEIDRSNGGLEVKSDPLPMDEWHGLSSSQPVPVIHMA